MKRSLLILLSIAAIGLIWYLFFKKYDYTFQMQSKYGPGVAYYEIANWKNFNPDSRKKNIAIIHEEPFTSLTQNIEIGTSDFLEMHWEFERRSDSTTNVSLQLRSPKNEFKNRLDIINPFTSSVYVDTLKERILNFRKRLQEVQNTYKVNLEKEIVKSPEMNCICYSSTNIPVESKANKMLQTIGYLEDYVLSRNLNLTGPPFVKVNRWDRKENLIDFDFCFPLNLAQDIKPTPNIDFREMKTFTALKATFHGNYRLSHLAWYDLLDKAKSSGLRTNELPLEVFFNNPKVDSFNPMDWKAEIFLPVVDSEN